MLTPPTSRSCTPATRLACIAAERPEHLLPACRRLTLRTERHPRMLVLDLTGCDQVLARLTPAPHPQGEEGWSTIAPQLAQFLSAVPIGGGQLGLAPTRTLAWLAATQASAPPHPPAHPSWRIIAPEDSHAFLHPLPLTTLLTLPELAANRAAHETLTALACGGVTTVGQLLRLSQDSLCRRFGSLGKVLLTLADGRDVLPFRPARISAWLGVRLRLAQPASGEQLVTSLPPLARRLAQYLVERQQAGCALELALQLETGGTIRLRRALARPVSTAVALAEHALHGLSTLLHHREAAHGSSSELFTSVQLRIGELHAVVPDQVQVWGRPPQQARRTRLQHLYAALTPLTVRYSTSPLLRARCVSPHAVLPAARYALVARNGAGIGRKREPVAASP